MKTAVQDFSAALVPSFLSRASPAAFSAPYITIATNPHPDCWFTGAAEVESWFDWILSVKAIFPDSKLACENIFSS